ncbi:MAG: bifunctional helix-turn-helix domain-containing protein/methylated-DNA--[protein]-cysteine S-methyltransferase [Beijerinckiaceae bacterium]|nr:bifunctional helix-turn-helix domain-containing protein/methylated-DNA--[protein]-cysteine S-methyltransferase [Beijerinckiaceae bacterium]
MLDRLASTPLAAQGADYALVRRAIRFISEESREQPGIEAIADAVSLTPVELTALFRRWAGLTPKAFLQAVTLDHAKRLLDEGLPLLDAALETGLSGPSRLHDLFVTHEAISPGEYKSGGEGLEIDYDFVPSPFGPALPMLTARGLCGLAFADEGGEQAAFEDMTRRWPRATYRRFPERIAPIAARIFEQDQWRPERPLRVFLIGTDFEVRVWETLLGIPMGRATTYGAIAGRLQKPSAARAVGAAVGRNPVSFVVPCHRVVGKSGALTGYHWGLTRKRAMLGWEAGQLGS